MGYVKHKATTKASISGFDFEAQKEQYLFDIRTIVDMEEIPEDLNFNWDHTAIHYVPVSNWTMAPSGSKRIEVAGLNDKRQITVVFAATMAGDFLSPQVIYAGKTQRYLPDVKYPSDWSIKFTENHWANEQTTEAHIKDVLVPYIENKRRELSLPPDHSALVIFDKFRGQCTSNILSLLDDHNIRFVVVPAHCTN